MYFVCHSGTVCDVCRCYSLGTDRKTLSLVLKIQRGDIKNYAPDALHPKTIVVKGILADECARLMKDFFRKTMILISPLHNLHTLPHPHQRFFFLFPDE